MKANAVERRASGELAVDVIDDFDLLSVNHFFNLFDTYYEDLCPSDSKTEEQQKNK
jgi:hypothetical protein